MLAKSRSPDASACFDARGSVRVDLLVAQEVAEKGESKVAARLKRRAPLKVGVKNYNNNKLHALL